MNIETTDEDIGIFLENPGSVVVETWWLGSWAWPQL